jgi:hypothetical protein
MMVYVAVRSDLSQHLSWNGVGANRGLTADASGCRAYMEALALFCALPKMRIDFPRSHHILVGSVDMAILVFLA